MTEKKRSLSFAEGFKTLSHRASLKLSSSPLVSSPSSVAPALKSLVGRAKTLRRHGNGSSGNHTEIVYEYDPNRFSPTVPIAIWESVFLFLAVPDLYALSHVNKIFYDFFHDRSLFQNTISAYTLDDANPFPHVSRIPKEMHGPLAVALHEREANWRSGHVRSVKVLTGHNSSNIRNMTLGGPWFLATFTDEDTLRVWDLRNASGKGRVISVLDGLAFSMMRVDIETNCVVAAIEGLNILKIYDILSGYIKQTYVTEVNEGPITALTSTAEAAAAGFKSGKVILWDPLGMMEYCPTEESEESKIIGIEIYGKYILSVTASGYLNTHTTEDPSLPIIKRLRLPSFTNPLHIAQYARFARSGLPSLLMATFERPDNLEDAIFNFHQDITYDIYHITWDSIEPDAPLHRPKIRYWPSDLPGHNVRWEDFEHVSKGRAVVAHLNTNTMSPMFKVVWPRERKVVEKFWSDSSSDTVLLKEIVKRDGWVPGVGVDDEKIIVTGRWQEFCVLDFGSPQLQRMRQALEEELRAELRGEME